MEMIIHIFNAPTFKKQLQIHLLNPPLFSLFIFFLYIIYYSTLVYLCFAFVFYCVAVFLVYIQPVYSLASSKYLIQTHTLPE